MLVAAVNGKRGGRLCCIIAHACKLCSWLSRDAARLLCCKRCEGPYTPRRQLFFIGRPQGSQGTTWEELPARNMTAYNLSEHLAPCQRE